MSIFSLIVAMDETNLIGNKNSLPWHIPEDLHYFKKITSGHTVIMGRKTFESIGKPLPQRKNIILTRNKDFQTKDCIVLHSVEEIIDFTKEEKDEIFIIGGKEIYSLFLPYIKKYYITRIYHTFKGDTYLHLDLKNCTLISHSKGVKDDKNPYDYEFLVYHKMAEDPHFKDRKE